MADATSLTIDAAGQTVSALLTMPKGARACYVVGHGAGVGMHHTFMQAVADGLSDRGIATLRYQFPYMERGDKRPDPPKVAMATVRAAVEEAARVTPGLALFAGGKSYGGRMTSQTQAAGPLPGVRGIAFLGFPLHAPDQPSDARSEHLFNVRVPMLFLQGARDKLADLSLLAPIVERIGQQATLSTFEGADHSFHVQKSSGKTDADVMKEMLDTLAKWIDALTR